MDDKKKDLYAVAQAIIKYIEKAEASNGTHNGTQMNVKSRED